MATRHHACIIFGVNSSLSVSKPSQKQELRHSLLYLIYSIQKDACYGCRLLGSDLFPNANKPFPLVKWNESKHLYSQAWKFFVVLCIKQSLGSWGSAPDPNGGACSTPPYLLAGQQGVTPPAPSPGRGFLNFIQILHLAVCTLPYIHVLSWLHHCMVESTYNMLCTPRTHNLATGLVCRWLTFAEDPIHSPIPKDAVM